MTFADHPVTERIEGPGRDQGQRSVGTAAAQQCPRREMALSWDQGDRK